MNVGLQNDVERSERSEKRVVLSRVRVDRWRVLEQTTRQRQEQFRLFRRRSSILTALF